jgi:hypothetical protein
LFSLLLGPGGVFFRSLCAGCVARALQVSAGADEDTLTDAIRDVLTATTRLVAASRTKHDANSPSQRKLEDILKVSGVCTHAPTHPRTRTHAHTHTHIE